MDRIDFVAVLFASTAVVGCQQKTYAHDDDAYATRSPAGWRRTIGTDFFAENNEYLYFNDLPMEWSTDASGSGYFYATKAGENTVVWSFDGQPRSSRTISVRDGATLTCTHVSGVTFEVEVVKQTKHYINVFYREKGSTGDQGKSDESL